LFGPEFQAEVIGLIFRYAKQHPDLTAHPKHQSVCFEARRRGDQEERLVAVLEVSGPMEFLGLDISTWANLGVAFATLVLAFITAITIREMRLQQKKDRLQKEMTLLVGPLHSRQNAHFYFGLWREHRPWRDTIDGTFGSKTYYDFWDGIMINMYLGEADLLSALQNYIDATEAYWDMVGNGWPPAFDNTTEGRQRIQWFETTREALRIETDRRYKNLRKEISQLEKQHMLQLWK
jgi:hypothetical protein